MASHPEDGTGIREQQGEQKGKVVPVLEMSTTP
jgi:hypothetical protein